ncbi:MAG TPA: biotin/lipoyl-binding protein [Candidatus Dormibacteraeota bacterium]|jgi:multidrug efflux pump subunit AcrA (membrane-fusion protein)|nr:biotin/lipoyl-binding protein [Candidatus Dormibacteraeota bacterium]
MRQAPTLKPLPQIRRGFWLSGTRAWLAGLGLVAVLLVGLIARDTVFAQPAAVPLRTATADRGTVTNVVSGTGSLLPAGRMNVSFKQTGILTEVDVKVGDKVTTGQVLARIDSTAQQAALASAQASLASAQANLQTTQSPLTGAQVAQLQHQVSNAQQNYNDTVASVNATNQSDAATVASDQAKVNAECPNGAQCSQLQAQLASDKTKQNMDAISGQSRINSAAQQITSARDNLAVQTQVKPNALASSSAQVASAQAQVQAAQLAVNQTTLAAPTSGVVISINGVPGETAGGGTAQSPGSLAPQPSSGASGGGSGFMVIDDNSNFVAVMPFAETDAARLAANQPVAFTFDAIPSLTISGHVLAISPSATVVSNVVNYYVSFVLNRTDPRLREGMTANASVTVAQADNAVRVPNAAVHTTGGTTMVTLLSKGQQVPTEVITGVVGDTYTEIKAGLNEGDTVVLPAIRTTTGTTSSGGNLIRGGGGFGGGGAVRGGGG